MIEFMTDDIIRKHVYAFRKAIDDAKYEGKLDKDFIFCRFPRACCGDTCYLLAEYLRVKGIETIYVCGDFDGQTHAWLVVKDERIEEPIKETIIIPQELKSILSNYGENVCDEYEKIVYEEKNIISGLMIDITGDQFGQIPVYIDYMNDFYRQFYFCDAHDYQGLSNSRLQDLYEIINDYIEE